MAKDSKLVKEQSEKESKAIQTIRIVQPTTVFYEMMNNLFLMLAGFGEVVWIHGGK